MIENEIDLLIDLMKLLKKYGPDSFVALAKMLSSPQLNEAVTKILIETATAARAFPKKEALNESNKQQLTIPKALAVIESTDPQKYQLLVRFHKQLTSKAILPTLHDVKEIALSAGKVEIRADSRSKAIGPLITALAKRPYDELLKSLPSAGQTNQPSGDRSLESWSKIILNKKENEP